MGLISRVSSRTYRKSRVKFKKKTNNTKPKMSFVINNENFQHILRIQNTNIDGNIKIGYALTSIQGMGRRFTDLVLKKAEIDVNKRAGQINAEELERMKKIRLHRGIRHMWTLRVKGQKTKTTGRHGRTVGVLQRQKK